MNFRPEFGNAIASEEKRYLEYKRDNLGYDDFDAVWAKALKFGGDTLSNPMMAAKIAWTRGVSIEEAVAIVHTMLWS